MGDALRNQDHGKRGTARVSLVTAWASAEYGALCLMIRASSSVDLKCPLQEQLMWRCLTQMLL